MGELRAYAVGEAELRAISGAPPAAAARFRALVTQAYEAHRPAVRDMLGPLYRRVPGRAALRDDEPAPGDLDALLAGDPVRQGRAAATWRLIETAAAGLAWSSTRGASDPPAGLRPLDLAVPAASGLHVGWSTLEDAARLPVLTSWLAAAAAWESAAGRAGRPRPDVVCFQTA